MKYTTSFEGQGWQTGTHEHGCTAGRLWPFAPALVRTLAATPMPCTRSTTAFQPSTVGSWFSIPQGKVPTTKSMAFATLPAASMPASHVDRAPHLRATCDPTALSAATNVLRAAAWFPDGFAFMLNVLLMIAAAVRAALLLKQANHYTARKGFAAAHPRWSAMPAGTQHDTGENGTCARKRRWGAGGTHPRRCATQNNQEVAAKPGVLAAQPKGTQGPAFLLPHLLARVAANRGHWPLAPATAPPTEAVDNSRSNHRQRQRRLAARPPPASAAAPAGQRQQVLQHHTHLERQLPQPCSSYSRWWGRRGHRRQQLLRQARLQFEPHRPRRCSKAQGPQRRGSCWEQRRPQPVAVAAELLAQPAQPAAGPRCC